MESVGGETYSGWPFTASVALLVKIPLQFITTTTVLLHAFPQALEKVCTFEAHLADGSCEANFA